MGEESDSKPKHPSITEKQRVQALQALLDYVETGTGDFDRILFAVLGRHSGPDGGTLTKPSAADDSKFRERVLTSLREIAAGKPSVIRPPAVTISFNQGGRLPRYEARDEITLREFAADQLKATEWWRIAACARPQCAKLFIKRGRSLYHDGRCASAARQGRFYHAHREGEQLARLRKQIEAECPRKRRANLHGTKTGYQHRIRQDGKVLCERWGVGADVYDRTPIERQFENAYGRELEKARTRRTDEGG